MHGFTFDTHSLPNGSTSLIESTWGEVIDPREQLYDSPGFFDDFGYGPKPSVFEDRVNGDYLPIYQTELELATIRGISHALVCLEPRAVGVQDLLTNYIIGTGFKFTAQADKNYPDVPAGLQQSVQKFIDRFLDANNFTAKLDREIHSRSRDDGEVLLGLEWCKRSGIPEVILFEPEQLTEPISPYSLEEYIDKKYASHGVDCSIPCLWKYGVHRPERRPASPFGYHIIHDSRGGDWDYYPADQMEHIKRNVTAKAARGVSDFWWVFSDMGIESKIRRNTGIGTALNAAIAWVEEFASGTTLTQAKGMVTDRQTGTKTVRTEGGSRSLPSKAYSPGTILSASAGMQMKEGPMGSNRNPDFLLPGDYILRCIGTRWQTPEYMISGDASNGNYASTMVAESPFVKARESDQEFYAGHFKSLIWKAMKMAFREGWFTQFGIPWSQILQMIDIKCDPPKIATHDPKAMADIQSTKIQNGTLSVRTAIAEDGRDPDEELRLIQEDKAAAIASNPLLNGSNPTATLPPDGQEGNPQQKVKTDPPSAVVAAFQESIESAETDEERKAVCRSVLREFYP